MSSKKNKKNKKKAASSLIKFLKNRKNLSVALGICLAVFASAYVATAKFSASSKSGTWEWTYDKVVYTVKVTEKNKPVEGISIRSNDT